ncbi:MAG: DUF2937 family protein [Marinovum sp.]|nr:DUF2937 family protein [Marinovum sp.]
MIGRVVTMAAGLTGAAGMSQFPEYSQQYMQRLGGAVDALEQVVADFDASAQSSGYTREEALNQLQGTEFLDKRRADITRTIARSEKLSADLNTLQGAGPFTRAYYAARFTDNDLASAALENYKPAMPITFDGIVFAITGFLAGSITLAGVMWLIRRPFQRKNTISPS